MSSGEFIIHENDLRGRNRWLEANATEVAPYLRDGKDCIVFTFSRQEPVDLMTTRIGGLPYWPRERPWPVCKACGQPLTFTAQLDFRDPRVRATVPGDLLTVHYCMSCWPWRPEDPGSGVLTWQNALPSDQLLAAGEIPETPEEVLIGPFYGDPHDAVDFPTPPEAFGDGIAGEPYTYLQFTLQGTKIGGYPPPIQHFDVPVDARGDRMRFLGTIGSVQAYCVDQSDASNAYLNSDRDLVWGDMGCLYLWISGNSPEPEMQWFIECY